MNNRHPPTAPEMLMVFVDGLGIGPANQARNPVRDDVCPNLMQLMREACVPIDACLGVPGLPQSATGQTTLLTGINAAAHVKRHVEGFPGNLLKALIKRHNIFSLVAARGLTATFANAYHVSGTAALRRQRRHSVTTVAALSGLGTVRTTKDLLDNKAVYHDLTRVSLRDRGYTGPLVSPTEAARHLIRIATHHHLTLFEFFATDRAGHRAELPGAASCLASLDRFLGALLSWVRTHHGLLVLTSDHGNIEDQSTPAHTRHPVPFIADGPGAASLLKSVHSLVDVTPALLDWYRRRGTLHG